MKFTIAVFFLAAAQALSLKNASDLNTIAADMPEVQDLLAQTQAGCETMTDAQADIIFGCILDMLC